jgi:hypothetical protein
VHASEGRSITTDFRPFLSPLFIKLPRKEVFSEVRIQNLA